jgi:preprotein translocase subunit SecD
MNIRLTALIVILLVSILLLASSLGKLNFGIDIQGGKVFIFKPEKPNELEKIAETINKRIKFFNLLETKAYVSDNTIAIVSLTEEKLNLLLIPGNFEAKILQEIKLENETGKIKIGTNVYQVELEEEKLKINDSLYEVNQSFFLEDIEFDLINITNNSATIEAKIFTNEDVTKVLTQFSYLRFEPELQSYEFNIPLEISSQASSKFTKVAKGLKTTFVGTQQTLEGFLIYYLDGKQISKLHIPFELSLRELKNIAVIGFGRNQTEILEEKNKIQAVLESGRLPKLKLTGTEGYEPKLRRTATEISIGGVVIMIILAVGLTYFRYRIFRLSAYSLALIASEIVCILGAVALTQRLFAYGWILDFHSILGIIVFAIISSIQIILILENRIRKKELSLEYKYRKILSLQNFLTITIFAISFCLLFTSWKGFGLALLTGLTFGILITKPIFDQVVTRKFL